MADSKGFFSADTVIVGGKGGNDFSFKSAYNNFRKFTIIYNKDGCGRVTSLRAIQVLLFDYHMIQIGRWEGDDRAEFSFELEDKVVSATLWPNQRGDRFGGLEFVVLRNGERKTMSFKCAALGAPVTANIKSGKFLGVAGRSGDEIDALGFYFN